MYSDEINVWREAKLLQEPKYAWECVQIGNSGSPIETDRGWLLLTHGVGTMRQYSLGAILLDLEDPSIVIGRLEQPLLVPNETEREGYVPNVVYSCGAIINNKKVIIPYAMSDTASSCMWVDLDELFSKMIPESKLYDFSKKNGNILLVEDDLINQKIVTNLLRNLNYRVSVADNGVSALMEIAKTKFDIVLSDINMPKFDGFQLLEYMNENEIQIPLIFMTSIEDESFEFKGLELGAVEYIKKPVNADVLSIKLKRLLSLNK
jgi:CheY-like chemotaxis protein